MSSAASNILGTVNARSHTEVSAAELATCITDVDAVARYPAQVLAFFTDVSLDAQRAFIAEMDLDMAAVTSVADYIAARVPYRVALAS